MTKLFTENTTVVQEISISSSLRCWHNFGRQVFSIFLVKIIAALSAFYRLRRLGGERNLYQEGEQRSKRRREEGWGDRNSCPLPPPSTLSTVYKYRFLHNCVNTKICESDWLLTALTHELIGYCKTKLSV